MPVEHLRKQFAVDGVEFASAEGGLTKAVVRTPVSSAEIFLHGAHVARFALNDEPPLLFISRQSRYESGKAIRGGVPLIFPWFGPNSADPSLPAHGFARTRVWDLVAVERDANGEISLKFQLDPDAGSREVWPREFRLTYTVRVGRALQLSLQVQNTGDKPFRFEEAMHTYLAVSDVRNVKIEGLLGRDYFDKTEHGARKTESQNPLMLIGETDRLYVNTRDTVVVTDPTGSAAGGPRVIAVSKQNSASTVVWNPWIARAAALTDFGDDEWPHMLCVETANAAENALTLEPGATHTMSAAIEVL